jgi:hypothetical protein
MTSAKAIFVNFLKRLDFTEEQAVEEYARVSDKSMPEYLTMPRYGATKALKRSERHSVYMSWENAQNHASFV